MYCKLQKIEAKVYACQHRGCERVLRIEFAPLKRFRELPCTGEPDTDEISEGTAARIQAMAAKPIRSKFAGPGTELRKLFASLGVGPKGCGCPVTAARMDQHGPKWCRTNIDALCLEIASNASKWGKFDDVTKLAEAGLKALELGIVIDPENPIASFVEEACRRAEAAASVKTTAQDADTRDASAVDESNVAPT